MCINPQEQLLTTWAARHWLVHSVYVYPSALSHSPHGGSSSMTFDTVQKYNIDSWTNETVVIRNKLLEHNYSDSNWTSEKNHLGWRYSNGGKKSSWDFKPTILHQRNLKWTVKENLVNNNVNCMSNMFLYFYIIYTLARQDGILAISFVDWKINIHITRNFPKVLVPSQLLISISSSLLESQLHRSGLTNSQTGWHSRSSEGRKKLPLCLQPNDDSLEAWTHIFYNTHHLNLLRRQNKPMLIGNIQITTKYMRTCNNSLELNWKQ